MSVHKLKNSPYWQYDFEVNGVRFYGSTKLKDRKKAEALEKDLKADAKKKLKEANKNGPLTINLAAGRFWHEVGQYHSGAADTERDLARLVNYFGPNKLLTEIDDAAVIGLVAWRREQTIKGRKVMGDGKTPAPLIKPATVNRSTTEVLKKLFTRAKRSWKYTFHNEPHWKDHWLKEPKERVRELHAHEDEALTIAVREDYWPWLEYLHTSAVRLEESLLKWEWVNWSAGLITVPDGKGGERVPTPITKKIHDILWPLRDHHPEWVFTYVCKTANAKNKLKKGKRYPITYEGAKTQWRRLRARAGVKDFRLHDLRHDTATKVLRKSNLKVVQSLLNHRSISTTAKYAHAFKDDVAAAMEAVAESQILSQTKKKKVA